jgi:hypothetical protein
MIRIERVQLPPGLRALADRDTNGNLIIYVSAELDARRQRAAVMEAVRASRRAGWRVVLPGLVVALAGARMLLRGVVHSVRTQLAAWSAVAAGTAGAAAVAVLVVVTGHPHGAAGGARPQPGGVSVPAVGATGAPRSSPARPGGQVTPPGPSGSAPGAPGGPVTGPPSAPPPGGPSSAPSPTPSSPGSPGSPPPPSPTPTATATPTQPASPSPSPAPSPPKKGKPGTCVIVLGIEVCVPLSLSVSAGL